MPFLLTTLVVSSVFGQIFRCHFLNKVYLLPIDIVLVITILCWFFWQVFHKNFSNFNAKKIFWPSCFFFLWALFSLIFNIHILQLSWGESLYSFAYYARYLLYFSLIFIFSSQLKYKNNFYWKQLIFIPAFFIAILGFLQLKFFPNFDALNMQRFGWDPHIGRLLSTWFDPNLLGGYFVFILSLLGGEIWDRVNKKQDYLFLTLIFIIILAALFLTYSRSAYLAFLVAGFLFALIRDRKLLIVGFLIIGLTVIFSERTQQRVQNALKSAEALFTETEKTLDPTARLRLKSWQIGWGLFQENPVTGVGFNTLKFIQKQRWAFLTKSHAASGIDSSLLTVAATTGSVGLILFLWIWFVILKESMTKFLKTKSTFFIGFFVGIIGLFVHAIFVNTLFFNLIFPTLFLVIALILEDTSYQLSKNESIFKLCRQKYSRKQKWQEIS